MAADRSNARRLFEPAHLNSIIEKLRAQATATKNPLPAWGAISLCVSEGRDLPEWAVEYIGAVAHSLWNLALRCAGEELGSHEVPLAPLSPKDALANVTDALGLRKGTVNAFAAFKSDQAHLRDAVTRGLPVVFPDRISASQTIETIASRRSLARPDEVGQSPSVRKRVKKGAQIRKRIDKAQLPG